MSRKAIVEEYEKSLSGDVEPGLPRWFAWAFAFYAVLSLVVSVTITGTVLIWFFSQ